MDRKELKKKRLELISKIDQQKKLCNCKESNADCENCESVAFLGEQMAMLKNRDDRKSVSREEFCIDTSYRRNTKNNGIQSISKEEYNEYKLKGYSDKSFAEMKGISLSTVKNWKYKNCVSSTNESIESIKMTKEDYLNQKEKGVSDIRLAYDCGVTERVFVQWKHANELIGIRVPVTNLKLTVEQYMNLHKQGKFDKEISKRIGCKPDDLKFWKKNNGIVTKVRRTKKQLEKGVI